jgi:hypothetical protein
VVDVSCTARGGRQTSAATGEEQSGLGLTSTVELDRRLDGNLPLEVMSRDSIGEIPDGLEK